MAEGINKDNPGLGKLRIGLKVHFLGPPVVFLVLSGPRRAPLLREEKLDSVFLSGPNEEEGRTGLAPWFDVPIYPNALSPMGQRLHAWATKTSPKLGVEGWEKLEGFARMIKLSPTHGVRGFAWAVNSGRFLYKCGPLGLATGLG
jgi:hypothetical protein